MLTTLANENFEYYGPVGVLLLMGLAFGLGNIFLTHFLDRFTGVIRKGMVKGMVYESGMNPIGSTHRRFNVRFYIVAMTFLVFDVEIVFLYPWATVFPNLDATSGYATLFLLRMLFFVLTSVLAFAYAWRKGVFRYD